MDSDGGCSIGHRSEEKRAAGKRYRSDESRGGSRREGKRQHSGSRKFGAPSRIHSLTAAEGLQGRITRPARHRSAARLPVGYETPESRALFVHLLPVLHEMVVVELRNLPPVLVEIVDPHALRVAGGAADRRRFFETAHWESDVVRRPAYPGTAPDRSSLSRTRAAPRRRPAHGPSPRSRRCRRPGSA